MIEPQVPRYADHLTFFIYAADEDGGWIDQGEDGSACTLKEAVAKVPSIMRSKEFFDMGASQIRIQMDVNPSLAPFKAEYDGEGNLLWVEEGFERYCGIPLTKEEREGSGDALARIGL